MSDQLPSLDDLLESKLPSVDDFIKEDNLPSVDEFLEKEEEIIEEESCGEGEYFCNDEQKCKPIPKGHKVLEDGELVKEQVDLTEIVRLINDVRKDIPVVPEIPEIKYYDEELEKLTAYVEEIKESIPEIPEQKTYDVEVEAICDLIDNLREEVKDLPVPKYYEEEIEGLQKKVNGFYQDMMDLPEPKYYEEDLKSLKEEIIAVREAIPTFPKWVNEVNEVPDFKWIGKTFSVIDDDFIKVQDHLDSIKNRIDQEVQQITEIIEVKRFESKTDITKLNEDLEETKEKIYKELREAALKIYDAKNGYKDDDRKLKKQLLNQFHVLKQNVLDEIKEFNRKNIEIKDLYGGYFDGLTEEISNLPEVKYYDEDIQEIREEIKLDADNLKSLKELVQEIKEKQIKFKQEFNEVRDLQEGLLNEPPDNKQSVDGVGDPLAPLDKQFPTLKSLADHYRLFINRTQQQIATIGGGGAGFIKDLGDVTFTESTGTNKLLIYNGDGWVGIASTALSGSSTLHEALAKGNVSGIGMSVGVITATNGYFSGIVTASTLNYDVVTDIYSTGIVTATKGIQVTTLGLNVASGVATLTDGLRVGSAATIYSNGNASFSGIVTAKGGFVGDGSGLTGVANTDNVSSTTLSVSGVVTAIGGLYVGTAASIFANGNVACGIITATSFTVGGTSLAETIADTVGGMVSSNTESGITVAYQDADNTLDFTVGTLNQNTTGTAGGLSGTPNITVGDVVAASLDISGNTDIDGTLEADAITVDGTALNEYIADTVGAMVSSNTESGITVAYVDDDNTLDFTVGTLNQNTTGTAALAEGLTGTPDIDCATGSFTGDVDIADKIVHTGDTNTAIRFPAADTITAETGGSERLRVTSAGVVGINTTTGFDTSVGLAVRNGVSGSDHTMIDIIANTNETSRLVFSDDADHNQGRIQYNHNGNSLGFYTNGNTERLHITSAGRVNIVGICSAAGGFVGDGSNLTNLPGVASESDTSVSSTSATTVATFSASTYRTAFVDVQITQGSAYQAGQYALIHDGTTATIVEKVAVATGSMLGTLTTTVSGGNMLLQVNMGSSSSATVTVKSSTITV